MNPYKLVLGLIDGRMSEEQASKHKKVLSRFENHQLLEPVHVNYLSDNWRPWVQRDRAVLVKLFLEETHDRLVKHRSLTKDLVERCLKPVADKSSWPQNFPSECEPTNPNVNRGALQRRLQMLPMWHRMFRVYYALATVAPEKTVTRLWDFEQQVNTRLYGAQSLLDLPGNREPLGDVGENSEKKEARKIFYQTWLQIIEQIHQEQVQLLEKLGENSGSARDTVLQRIAHLQLALRASGGVEQVVYQALNSDRGLELIFAKAYRQVRFGFFQQVLNAMSMHRIVGLIETSELTVEAVLLAHNTLLKNQTEAIKKIEHQMQTGNLTNAEMMEFMGPLEAVLEKRKDLCAAATMAFYEYSNRELYTNLGIMAGFIGASVTPLNMWVLIGLGAAMTGHQVYQADTHFLTAWDQINTSNFDTRSVIPAAKVLDELNAKQAGGQGILLLFAGGIGMKQMIEKSIKLAKALKTAPQ